MGRGLNGPHELVAVHHRHHEVRDDRVRATILRDLQAARAVWGRHDGEVLAERLREEARHLRVVFHDEDERFAVRRHLGGGGDVAQRGQRTARRVGSSRGRRGRAHVRSERRRAREHDAELRAAAGRVERLHGAAVQLDEVPDDGEPEARPAEACVGRTRELNEALEDRRALRRRDPGPTVVDDDLRRLARARDAHHHLRSRRRDLHGVREQVHDDARNFVRVHVDQELRRRLRAQPHASLGGHDLELGGDRAGELRQIDHCVIRTRLARVDLGDVEEIVHLPEEGPRVVLDGDEVGLGAVREARGAAEPLGEPEDQRERRP